MTRDDIDRLLATGHFPGAEGRPELMETHISWVILSDREVYKIKKPIVYSFLDFSSPEKRRYYCERELLLNRRLAPDVYLGLAGIHEQGSGFALNDNLQGACDYAVKMRRLDRDKQMNLLLRQGLVRTADIEALAEKIALFHKNAEIVFPPDPTRTGILFNDLGREAPFLEEAGLYRAAGLIRQALEFSDRFIREQEHLFTRRILAGYCRDGHGDLHTRNIFLCPEPIPFDCIEFNDEFRQIDVLNDIAFLCMDFDAYGRPDLSAQFLESYNRFFPGIRDQDDFILFMYYKSYRANVRAKVNSLRARSASSSTEKETALQEAEKYLHLMTGYLEQMTDPKG